MGQHLVARPPYDRAATERTLIELIADLGPEWVAKTATGDRSDHHITISDLSCRWFGFSTLIGSATASIVISHALHFVSRKLTENPGSSVSDWTGQACEGIAEELANGHGAHRLYFCFPALVLPNQKALRIGEVVIRNLAPDDASLFAPVDDDSQSVDRKPQDSGSTGALLENNLGTTVLELEVGGYQYGVEESVVVTSGWRAITRVVAYFIACRAVLDIPEAMSRWKADWRSWPREAFLVAPHSLGRLMEIGAHGNQYRLYEDSMALDEPALEQIRRMCHLDGLHALFSSSSKLREKVERSLDWYLKGLKEDDATNKLVCLFISLEAMMTVGGDRSVSLSSELADNVSLLCFQRVEDRIAERKFFRERCYPLRNSVMHHGHVCSPDDEVVTDRLKTYIPYCLVGILRNLDKIIAAGGMRGFFERAKFAGST